MSEKTGFSRTKVHPKSTVIKVVCDACQATQFCMGIENCQQWEKAHLKDCPVLCPHRTLLKKLVAA